MPWDEEWGEVPDDDDGGGGVQGDEFDAAGTSTPLSGRFVRVILV